jgi:hypothetical protein
VGAIVTGRLILAALLAAVACLFWHERHRSTSHAGNLFWAGTFALLAAGLTWLTLETTP